jgi:hypothetical protein
MIYKSWNDKPESELIGKYIFHKTKGGIPLVGSLEYGDTNIGDYLGKVTEITGPNRVFYTNSEASTKYVSLVGIGFVCDSDLEVQQIQSIKEQAFTKFKMYLTEISQDIKESLKQLSF